MQEECDVVVAGGGPAGLQFAREMAGRTDDTVRVLEANDDLTDNDKSTGGTFHQVVEGFDVPDDVIMTETGGVEFRGPTASGSRSIPGYVLDFPAFLEFLGRDAEALGATVTTGARVTDPVVEDGQVVGVRYRDGRDERTLRAGLVVDATGPRAVLAEDLGLFEREGAFHGVGKEFEVVGDHDDDRMRFVFDHDIAPGGYAWTFPAGEDVAKVGVCWVDDHFERHRSDDRTIDDYIRAWMERDERLNVDEVRAVHAGDAELDGSVNTRATDGLVALGDAVGSINPLFGEGIRPAMESARMGADAAAPALDSGDLSRERLAEYERAWNAERGRKWRLQYFVAVLLYDFTPAQQDRFARNFEGMGAEAQGRLQRYDLSARDLLTLYPFALDDLRKTRTLARAL